jgi:hypothetical protein
MRTVKENIAFRCGIFALLGAMVIIAAPRSSIAQAKVTSINKAVTITPQKATLFAGETQVFVAKLAKGDDSTVAWSVDEEDGGTVTTWGAYTAPKVQGVYHVTATSTVNPQKKASSIVTVVVYYDPPAHIVHP